VLALELIAEKKITEALEKGEFDDLPGRGRPLDLQEDPLVPEDLRMAYRILRNAGYVPEEVKRLSIGEKKLALLKARVESRYFSRVTRKLER
jgi:hypothetical protein